MADLRNVIPQNKQQSSRRVEWTVRYSFASYSLAASGQNTIFTLPKGYMHERLVAVLRTAEGGAGNFDVGITGDLDGFLDGGDANGTANARIALAGTESLTPGTYFHTDTPVIINIASAQPTLDAAVVDLVFAGFMIDTV